MGFHEMVLMKKLDSSLLSVFSSGWRKARWQSKAECCCQTLSLQGMWCLSMSVLLFQNLKSAPAIFLWGFIWNTLHYIYTVYIYILGKTVKILHLYIHIKVCYCVKLFLRSWRRFQMAQFWRHGAVILLLNGGWGEVRIAPALSRSPQRKWSLLLR